MKRIKFYLWCLVAVLIVFCIITKVAKADTPINQFSQKITQNDFKIKDNNWLISREIFTNHFDALSIHWDNSAETNLEVRGHRPNGGWGPWTKVQSASDHGPDHGSNEQLANSGTIIATDSDGYQLRSQKPVNDLQVRLTDPGSSNSNVSSQKTQRLLPEQVNQIRPRSSWDPDNKCNPRTNPTISNSNVKVIFVHHTVGLYNQNIDYKPQDVPKIILAMCLDHRDNNGWNDLGYQFVMDRFGKIYEGRAGAIDSQGKAIDYAGIDKPVVGAQAAGFNTESTGIVVPGNYMLEELKDGLSKNALQSLADFSAWKLSLSGITDVDKKTELTDTDTGESKKLYRISGHRDSKDTLCPGDALYDQLKILRKLASGR